MNRFAKVSRLLVLAGGILLLAGVGFALGRGAASDLPAAVALEPPAFLDDDFKADTVGEKIQDEAGIAAYYKAPNTLNLELIRPLFNSIELETADYILGSISVPNYAEHFDVHVYVRRDGWIMAYYLASAATSKMIDTRVNDSLNNTKLTIVMNNVAVTGGAPFGTVTYYNFNYPNATHMLIVREYGDEFEITIPSSYSYYELSWGGYYSVTIDGVNISYPNNYAPIPITSFLPDVVHTFEPTTYGALVIIYRQP
jgi:hypothetical protein